MAVEGGARPTVRGARNSFREFHVFLAKMLGAPEMEMTEEEARRFSEAYAEFRRHFPIPVVDPRVIAAGTMAYVTFQIYAPRVAAIAARKKGAAPAPPASTGQSGAGFAMPGEAAPAVTDWFTTPGTPPN